MTRHSILVAEASGFSARAAGLLRQTGDLILADLQRAELLTAVRDADVLWVRLRHHIDTEVLSAASSLKIIATPTTGLNHIDVEAVERRGIQIISLRSEAEFLANIRATAEHTVALILALFRHLPQAADSVAMGRWDRDNFKGRELYQKTVGIIGYGRLGRIVARYLKAFDMHVLAADPNVDADSVEPGVRMVPISELLSDADVVTLHVNYCEETRAFFGQDHFAAMKPSAWFINTARGELVDEFALLDALQSGQLAGAALDVLCGERSTGMADHPLVSYAREHGNLLITPHVGGCTEESMEKTEVFLAGKLCASLSSVCR
jgi:D-3-phosphoglycerate dehydrogenase